MFVIDAVHAAIDPRQRGRDLGDGAVQVVHARLERDGEIDEVVLPAAEQDELVRPHAPDLHEAGTRGHAERATTATQAAPIAIQQPR